MAVRHGVLLQALRNCAALIAGLLSRGGFRPTRVTSGVRFPFAPAVLAGVVFVLLWQA
jgi:prepilin signal peptidase PulO-like enzyme (type II secretory pathway)